MEREIREVKEQLRPTAPNRRLPDDLPERERPTQSTARNLAYFVGWMKLLDDFTNSPLNITIREGTSVFGSPRWGRVIAQHLCDEETVVAARKDLIRRLEHYVAKFAKDEGRAGRDPHGHLYRDTLLAMRMAAPPMLNPNPQVPIHAEVVPANMEAVAEAMADMSGMA